MQHATKKINIRHDNAPNHLKQPMNMGMQAPYSQHERLSKRPRTISIKQRIEGEHMMRFRFRMHFLIRLDSGQACFMSTLTHVCRPHMVTELSLAVNSQDRINAISALLSQLDHDDEKTHDEEIRQGAANALCQKLMIGLSRKFHEHHDEIASICRALRFVYRCSANVKDESFKQIGNDLLPLLSTVVEHSGSTDPCKMTTPHESAPLNTTTVDPTINTTSTSSIRHPEALEGSLGALRNLSSAPTAEVLMSRHKGFLTLLLKVVNNQDVSVDAKSNALNVIVNLAHCYENKSSMVECRGLLDTLVECTLNKEDLIRNASTCGLQNLTAHDENILVMVKHKYLLGAVVNLLGDENDETREFAAGTLQNLSVSRKNSVALVAYERGSIVNALLLVMAKDRHVVARNRSTWTLANILCADTLFSIQAHRGLLDTLAVVAAKDTLEDTRIQAALIFKTIVSLLQSKLIQYAAAFGKKSHAGSSTNGSSASRAGSSTNVSSISHAGNSAPSNKQTNGLTPETS